MAIDNQKIVFFVLIAAISVLGPFGLGFIGLEGGMNSMVLGGVLVAALIVADVFGMIDTRHLFGILLYLALNLFSTYILDISTALPFLDANSSAVFTVLFYFFTLLYMLHLMDIISGRAIGIAIIMVMLALSSFYVAGMVSNPELIQDQRDRVIKNTEVTVKNANIIDRIKIRYVVLE